MLTSREIASLMQQINQEWDTGKALMRLLSVAQTCTSSRNAMLARMNDELGSMQLSNGVGLDWTTDLDQKEIRLGVRQGIVGYVATKGTSFVSSNVNEEPLYDPLFASSRSEVAVPIRDRHGRIRAVLNVESDLESHYDEHDVQILEVLAGIAGVVISRAELLTREEALFQIGSAVDRAHNEGELLDQLLKIANNQLRFASCAIFLWDEPRQEFVLRASSGSLKDQVGIFGYARGEGCTGWVGEHGKSIRLANPQADPRWQGRMLEMPSDQIASYLAVPINHRGTCVGVIRVIRRHSDNPHHDNRFTEDDERVLTAIAEQIANGIEAIRALHRVVRVERMAAWGELSAKSSHMIGNRVFALRGDINELGHLLAEEPVHLDQVGSVQQSLANNLTRVEEILQEFRDFVSATQLIKAQADINFLVREAIAEVFPRRSKVKLVFSLAEKLPIVEVDARQLRRALSELVENSLSFFDEGQLRVSTKLAGKKILQTAKLDHSVEYVAIEVEDQGPGISADQKALIFQPFYSSRVKGMGLGLSIVKGILDAHGGAVIEIGRPGSGAKFVMLLPAFIRPKESKTT